MNTKLKATGIILGTLIVGMILGAAGHRLYMRQRISHFREMPWPHMMFYKMSETIIQPTAEQEKQIAPILEKYSQRLFKEHLAGRKRAISLLDSLQAELEPYLTEEQIERLEKRRGFGPDGFRPDMRPPQHMRFQQRADTTMGFPRNGSDSLHPQFRRPDSSKRVPPHTRGFDR